MSLAGPWGRVTPRWSVVSAVWPVLNAGLLTDMGRVGVRAPPPGGGLPASGPSPGSAVTGPPLKVPPPLAVCETTTLNALALTLVLTVLAKAFETVAGAFDTTSDPPVEFERIEFVSV